MEFLKLDPTHLLSVSCPPGLEHLIGRDWHKLSVQFDNDQPAPRTIACYCTCQFKPVNPYVPNENNSELLTMIQTELTGYIYHDPGDRVDFVLYMGACQHCHKAYWAKRMLSRKSRWDL